MFLKLQMKVGNWCKLANLVKGTIYWINMGDYNARRGL